MSLESAVQIAQDVLICPFEGYHKRLPDGGCCAYPDPGTDGEPWTIGWGTAGVPKDTVWTRGQADDALRAEATQKARGVLALSPGLAVEPDRRFAALISFAYNCGLGNYRISTLRKRVNARDWTGATQEIVKWNKANGRILLGLTRRRSAEAMMLK